MTERDDTGRSQSEVVVHGIKQMLLSGDLGPGARLPVESDLAAHLGVSRGSLREGVRALVAMGVLETRQGAGTYVTSLDAHLLLSPVGFVVDLHSASGTWQIQQVRRVLETEASASAALAMSAEAVQDARAVLASFATRGDRLGESAHVAAMEIDVEFHRLIARASGNPVLEALIEALASRTVRARLWRAIDEAGADERSHAEHVAILDAIERRDPQAAGVLMGAHLLAVERYLASDEARPGTPGPAEPAAVDGPVACGARADVHADLEGTSEGRRPPA